MIFVWHQKDFETREDLNRFCPDFQPENFESAQPKNNPLRLILTEKKLLKPIVKIVGIYSSIGHCYSTIQSKRYLTVRTSVPYEDLAVIKKIYDFILFLGKEFLNNIIYKVFVNPLEGEAGRY